MSPLESVDEADSKVSLGRFLLAAFLFIIGLSFVLGGLITTSLVAFSFWKIGLAQRQIHPLGGRLLLAYGSIVCTGIVWCAAAVYCITKQSRKAALAALLAIILYLSFFVIFPGPISLEP